MFRKAASFLFFIGVCSLGLTGCGGKTAELPSSGEENISGKAVSGRETGMAGPVEFNHKLDGYQPAKEKYNFYFTYKIAHPWWDAVALGIEEAADQYAEMGITIV